MKKRLLLAALLVVGTVFLRGDGCIMKKKVFDIVVKSETSSDFHAGGSSPSFTDFADVSLDDDIDKALADAGYSRDDIKKAIVVAGHYGAVVNNNSHDWTVSGSVSVARGTGGTPVVAMNYTSQSVDAAIGKKIRVKLSTDSVNLVNTAVNDYLQGQNGIVLRFTLDNATIAEAIDETIDFDWRAWVTIQVILSEEADWPDPF